MSNDADLASLRARIAELERENARLRAGVFEPSTPEVVRTPGDLAPLFAQVGATMRERFRQIDIDPARAMIGIAGERYLLVRASSLATDFLDTLVQLYADRGEREALSIARGFLFDIAHTIGLHDARSMHEQLRSREPLEKLAGGPIRFAYTGWGQVEIRPESRPIADDDFFLLHAHPYSFEAASFIASGRSSDVPVCIMGAGYSSGWCEASFGLELTAVEVACKARGDEECLFVMAPPHRIADQIRARFGGGDRGGAMRESAIDIPTYFERKRVEEELHRSIERLREAQEELVRKERLATVGLLVSGVAHEVNTPLGVAVTAMGVVGEEMSALRTLFEHGELTKGSLRAFLERGGQAAEMVRSNLDRAAAEITKFKRVSVDHSSEEPRRIDVGEYVQQTLDSLRPLVRRAGLDVRVRTGGDLGCVTCPGALAQIVTNFVTNTIMHGVRGDGSRTAVEITITRPTARTVSLVYRDAGRGMSEATRARAFQPFFTTTRGTGGTGLGLYVVQSLVADTLGGRVTLESELGAGTTLTVVFPVDRAISGA
ncbi:ATP-binding protein [Sandaracinus amylolyticus]|uniref:histidine kinase n=1 Tax=Sandaracinus amylolyticus TaxID=927083 RepID=A0A0F6W228_9BACT|nr:ATP-binding protein [Sandaracinus amylolyticus]AKF05493.1 Signal transduction histidine kinase [Sandaracinus amylolyticus]